jgi:uncharacterized protein DUF5681
MRGRPFRKGESGNPGGRPRAVGNLRELARRHAPAAIEELARLSIRAKNEAVRVAAARELFDRGYGRPTQLLEGSLECASLTPNPPPVFIVFGAKPLEPPEPAAMVS